MSTVEVFDQHEEDFEDIFEHSEIITGDLRILAESLTNQMHSLHIVNFSPDNYLDGILVMLRALKAHYEESQRAEEVRTVLDFEDEVLNTVYHSIMEYLEVDPETFHNTINIREEFREFVIALYEFFVIYRIDGVVNFFVSSIVDNKKDFVKTYKSDIDKKDIATYVERKKIRNFDNVVILESLNKIVADIVVSDEFKTDVLGSIVKNHEEELHNTYIFGEFESVAVPNLFSKFFANCMEENTVRSLINVKIYSTLIESFQTEAE